MGRPNQDFLDWAKEYEPLIASAARQYSKAAEYDDLYQEGMIALWNVYPEPNSKIVSKAVYNRMKNWIRFVKRQEHYQNASYEEILNDGV